MPRAGWGPTVTERGERLIDWGRAGTDRVVGPRGWAALAAVAGLAFVIAAVVPDSGGARWALAVVLGVLLMGTCAWAPRQGLVLTLAWLLLLGTTRRVVSTFQGDPSSDPLLLVGPAAAAVLAVFAFALGALRARGVLATSVAALSVLALVQVLNPDQGSLRTGLAGLLFWLVPMLWFWVGRGLLDVRRAGTVLVLAALGALASSVYALVQAAIGFPSWDARWIDDRGYAALYVGPDTVRPFGPFASAAELALVLGFGIVLAAIVALDRRRVTDRTNTALMLLALGAFAALVVASGFAAVRTAIVLTVFAFGIVLAVRAGAGLVRAVMIAVLVLAAMVGVFSQINAEGLHESGVQGMVRRVVLGIGDPLGEEHSTLRGHLDLAQNGVEEGFTDPLGDGTGSVTIAGDRFGGEGRNDTENDLSNAGLAFGILGMALVATVTVAAFVLVARRVRERRDVAVLAVLALMLVGLGSWWRGGHWFAAPLVWVLLGWLDAPATRTEPGAALPS